ncbi:outer membrane protein assembly factor BamB family protein [Actinoplanes friuliensis]|uniref:Pyrrolo-quinoline quinone repeat domain-containing protein n=1 Tax=Actinoplanes friuliensis DSM 7358 TaxID=1246995 RepID=U5W7E5_9ACTN|nr:PQQ-binding-like beta-propeller repeat protein [Actinoplanes friuliensis]AGZ43920.1 hypothetical protein AFR_28295 [Actinoplanes friuliensis DSM 7358]
MAKLVSGKDEGNSGQFSVAWQLEYPGDANGKDTDTERLYASWLVGDVVVRAQSDGVVGYSISDGSQVWGTPVPSGSIMCGATLTQQDGFAAITYGSSKKCDSVAGIDLRTGKETFTAKIEAEDTKGRFDTKAPLLNIVGKYVVVSMEDKVTAYEVADGKRRWTRTGGLGCTTGAQMAAGNGIVLVSEKCLGKGDKLIAVDAGTGIPKWAATVPRGSYITDIFSASPALARISPPGLDPVLLSFDAKGTKLAEIPQKLDGLEMIDYNLTARIGDHYGQRRYAFHIVGTTLYAPTMSWLTSKPDNQIVAVDLTTGKLKWGSRGSTMQFHTIRADESGVLGFEDGRFEQSPRLVRLDPATGATTTLATGAKAESLDVPSSADAHETAGTILFLPLEQPVTKKVAILALR